MALGQAVGEGPRGVGSYPEDGPGAEEVPGFEPRQNVSDRQVELLSAEVFADQLGRVADRLVRSIIARWSRG